MERRCGEANMGGDKWLSMMGNKNDGNRGRRSEMVEIGLG